MPVVHVLFGTESGNAEDLAHRTATHLKKVGFEVVVKDMADFAPDKITDLRTLLVITSTFGNGDPPFNAEALHRYLHGESPPLPELRFSVCALGDTTYEHFAKCGKDFDGRLEELSATRIAPREDCDVDYEAPFEAWLDRVTDALSSLELGEGPAVTAPSAPPKEAALGTRRNPLDAEVLVNRNLNGEGSDKETRHLELSLAGSSLSYAVGDSLGIWPENEPSLVDEVLAFSGADGDATVTVGERSLRLAEALSRRLDIVQLDARLVEALATPLGLSGDPSERQRYMNEHHVVDALVAAKPHLAADELVSCLRPLAPRLYSIASSPRVHPETVHLTIDVVRYELFGRARRGVVSAQVSERCPVGTRLPVYLHPATSFHLCAPDLPIIMIGPGTGVAPFRAFLQERVAQGAAGPSWLFFGSRHAATDFLYERELRAWHEGGQLTRLSTAFSRDQSDKVYVQHRMREHARELYRWVEDGAVIYVCGDAERMAPDVHRAWLDVISSQGSVSVDVARERLSALEASGRYQRDVY